MRNEIIFVDNEISFIQQLRLIHALSESEFSVRVRAEDESKLKLLVEYFDMQYTIGDEGGLNLSDIALVHHKYKVSTSVGGIERTLVFPHSIVNYCKSLWGESREHRYSFAGLVTNNRKVIITDWVSQNSIGEIKKLPNADSISYRIRKKLYQTLNLDDSIYKEVGDLVIWSSTRGRKYPEKAWDDAYFRFMANSEFVLCPSGNSIWSYRFFEAILCGAIPIIEESCPEYEGFKYYEMKDNAQDLIWTRETAEFNYNLCMKRITIDIKELNDELNILLGQGAKKVV